MSIHQLRGEDRNGMLALQWMELDTTVSKISVQIATDPSFTQNYHHFIVPNIPGNTGIGLAVSSGPWFYRAGAWTLHHTEVSWSGVYGPIRITTQRSMPPQAKGGVKAVHTQSIDGGLRLHTGRNEDYSILVEFTFQSSFTIEKMKYRWIRDKRKLGQIDILGLEPNYVYNLRYAQVEDSMTSIVEPMEWNVLKGRRSMPPRKLHSNSDHALYAAEKVLLQRARVTRPKLMSGTEYAQWLSAQEKAKAGMQREES